ncbi:MAG: hypothetical protein AAGA22_06920 [Pseudomonadota bacterium]
MTDRPVHDLTDPIDLEAALAHFSFRELFSQRTIAQRAVKRRRNTEKSEELIAAIDLELERRRAQVFARRSADIPDL